MVTVVFYTHLYSTILIYTPPYSFVLIILCVVISNQWEFQDPKMEVLYHIRPYFVGISPYIALTQALYMVGTSNLGSWNSH